jgi:hypothetical protein
MDEPFVISKKYINKRCGLHINEYQKIINDNGDLGISKNTRCSKHDHITKEEYLEIVVQIINEFLDNGFEKVLEQFHPRYDSTKLYKKLVEKTNKIDKITAQLCTDSNKIIKNTMYQQLYDVKDYKGNNYKSLWTKKNLEKAFNIDLKCTKFKPDIPKGQGETVFTNIFEILKRIKFNPVTIYSPLMTKNILNILECKTVFDPCIGWGGRMVGTCCIGGEYIGCEPSTTTFNGLLNIKNELNLKNVTLYNCPVEDILTSEEFSNKSFDCCLTSPPYFNLEIYCDEDNQSINKYKTYNEWLDNFIEPIIKYISIHCKKYSCWSVKNFKTDKEYNLYDDIVNLHKKYGWNYYTEYSILKQNKSNKKAKGDITYIFKPNE